MSFPLDVSLSHRAPLCILVPSYGLVAAFPNLSWEPLPPRKPETYSSGLGIQHFALSLCFAFAMISPVPWLQQKLGTPLALTPALTSLSSSAAFAAGWWKRHVHDPVDQPLP